VRRPAFGLVAAASLIVLFAMALFVGNHFAVGADEAPEVTGASEAGTAVGVAGDTPGSSDVGNSGDTSSSGDIGGEGPVNPFPNVNSAPSLDGGVDWLNTSGPISLRELRGKVVLLDFWTYCCINCMHVLPDLAYLEEKYADELVVVGVHSAKFDNEKDSEAIREAIMRYEIAHPVVNDANMVIWRKFGARSWPTFVLIDPEGNYCGYVSGEGNRKVLEQAIDKVIAFHSVKGTLDRTPVRFDLERYAQPDTPLRYPGKVLADPRNRRLFISDSNHNRIVVASFDGKLIGIIGSGRIGGNDGSFSEAEFDHPQGMALDGDTLYVADTENHKIRTVDLARGQVGTLVGTGEQASFGVTGGTLDAANLSSPWDVLLHDGMLYIAMAGPHTIWSHELGSNRVETYAGSGREDIIDGPRGKAAFAQPSGLATDGRALYVCDSEGSAIRRIPFDVKKPVSTLAGPSDLPNGQSLFTFGDVDGTGNTARLQHPLGIVFDGETFYVADSYNHKIKTIELGRRDVGDVRTWLGTGKAGTSLDPVQFSEPAGLTIAGRTLYIADTNNHRIVAVDIDSQAAREFTIEGLTPPEKATEPSLAEATAGGKPMPAPAQTVRPGSAVTVEVELALPPDFKLNPDFPLSATVASDDSQTLVAKSALGKRIKATGEDRRVQFSLPLTGQEGKAALRIRLNYGYCRDGVGGVCKLGTAEWLVPVTAEAGGAERIALTASPAAAQARN
jgi:sugar lactone lactonase YvrE/thiol-disulfide isomerase/thioredoxin